MKPFVASIVVLSALVSSPVAEAQEWRPSRPYRGLFAGGIGETEQLLTVTATVGTGWNKNLVIDPNGSNLVLGNGHAQFEGGASTGSLVLSYSFNGTRAGIGASAGTTARYYPSLDDTLTRREYASLGASALLGAGFSAQATANYQPYSLKSMYPWLFEPRLGDPGIVDEDFPDSNETYISYSGNLGYNHQLSRRNTFTANYTYQGRAESNTLRAFHRHTGSARVTRTLTRDLSLRMGYGYSRAFYEEGRRRAFDNHYLDVGLDYNKGLSFARRARVSFGSGTSATRAGGGSLRYHATGAARFSYEIGRTWTAAISYNRGLQFAETWPEPVFSDSATAGVSGLINSRTQVQVTARALHGKGWDNNEYGDARTYSGVAGITVAVTRHVSTALTYGYYQHKFAEGLPLAPGFPGDFDGQTIRASVSVWAPLFQSARRP